MVLLPGNPPSNTGARNRIDGMICTPPACSSRGFFGVLRIPRRGSPVSRTFRAISSGRTSTIRWFPTSRVPDDWLFCEQKIHHDCLVGSLGSAVHLGTNRTDCGGFASAEFTERRPLPH